MRASNKKMIITLLSFTPTEFIIQHQRCNFFLLFFLFLSFKDGNSSVWVPRLYVLSRPALTLNWESSNREDFLVIFFSLLHLMCLMINWTILNFIFTEMIMRERKTCALPKNHRIFIHFLRIQLMRWLLTRKMFDGERHTFHPVNRDILLIQSFQ